MIRACCPECGETLMGEFRPDPTDRTWVCVFCMKVIRQPAWMSEPASETLAGIKRPTGGRLLLATSNVRGR